MRTMSSTEDMSLINQKVNIDKRKQIQGVLKKKVVEEEEEIIFRQFEGGFAEVYATDSPSGWLG